MKKSTKLIIEIVAVVVVFAVASIAYNRLKEDAPSSSYVPTISAEKAETVVASNSSTQDTTTVEAVAENAKSTTSTDTQESESEMSSEETNVADESTAEEEVKEEAEESGNSLMPDIPVIMYPSKDESTFWDVVPKGKPVVINLFASWCPPCIEEMPGFVEVRESYKDDVTFIFFDSFDGSRETEATLKTFVDKTFAEDTLIVMDPGYMGYIFNSNSIPLTIILNDKGEIVRGFQGSISKDVLIGELENLI
jgi:thiol-disulfide isomerase/thioredoxin